jgi:hypothetical protein
MAAAFISPGRSPSQGSMARYFQLATHAGSTDPTIGTEWRRGSFDVVVLVAAQLDRAGEWREAQCAGRRMRNVEEGVVGFFVQARVFMRGTAGGTVVGELGPLTFGVKGVELRPGAQLLPRMQRPPNLRSRASASLSPSIWPSASSSSTMNQRRWSCSSPSIASKMASRSQATSCDATGGGSPGHLAHCRSCPPVSPTWPLQKGAQHAPPGAACLTHTILSVTHRARDPVEMEL